MNISHTIVATAVAATIGCSFSALAQNDSQNKNNNEVEVITIAGLSQALNKPQIAGSATVIGQAQIEASGAIYVGELLRTVAGVNLGQTGTTGSLSEVRFRGAESNHILVLVDGIAVNDIGQGDTADFSHILLSNVEKIEVLRGPQSALWGSSAIAGVINIVTKRNSGEQRVETSIGFGNKGTFVASANAGKQIGKLGFNINASTFKTGGENISRGNGEHDGYSNTKLNASVHYNANAHNSVNAQARIVDFENDTDGYDFSTGLVGDANNHTRGKQHAIGIDWHFAATESGNKSNDFSHYLALQYTENENKNYTSNTFNSLSDGSSFRLLFNNKYDISEQSWINLGIEHTQQEFRLRGATQDAGQNQDQSNSTTSIVSSGVAAASEDFSVNFSYRFDNNDEFDNASSYRVGANYQLAKYARLYASYGKAIKNPTFVERFGFFPGSFKGNPDLIPEHQKSIELGLQGTLEAFDYSINWFSAKLTDEILGFVFDPASSQFTAQNAITESKREGIEFSVSGQTHSLQWQAQYSYLDASENEVAELRRARHNASVSLTYNINEKHQVYLQTDYNGLKKDRFFPPFPQVPELVELGGYWLVSANYNYQVNADLRANLRIRNALDKQYEDVFGYNTDGRRVTVQLHYTW